MYQSSWIHTSKFQKYRCSEFKLYPFENFLLLIQISMKNHSSHINLPKFTPPNSKNIHIPIRFFSKYFIIPHNPNSKNIVVPNLNYILLKMFFFQSKFQPHINLSQIYTSHPNSILSNILLRHKHGRNFTSPQVLSALSSRYSRYKDAFPTATVTEILGGIDRGRRGDDISRSWTFSGGASVSQYRNIRRITFPMTGDRWSTTATRRRERGRIRYLYG